MQERIEHKKILKMDIENNRKNILERRHESVDKRLK